MSNTAHWDQIYEGKEPEDLTWYQPAMGRSMALIERFAPELSTQRVLDVGGGASTLVDGLLARGVGKMSVLDLSSVALEKSRQRLGARAFEVEWIVGDITEITLEAESVDVWLDRAVFHFLLEAEAREAYVARLKHALSPKGVAIFATFSLKGPERCSGLEVVRYSPKTLQNELGRRFAMVHAEEETHETPKGDTQEFIYCVFRKNKHD